MSEIFNFEKSPIEELRDLLPGTDGFDFGTSPHGLSADLPLSHQETPEASSLSFHAKPVLTSLEPFTSMEPSALPDAARTKEHGRPASCGKKPEVSPGAQGERPEAYTSPKVRSDSRCIREAAAKQVREGAHYLRLTEVEFLHAYAAVEQDRNRTRKAIRKGVADPQDLKASDSLWHVLQEVQARRLRKAWRQP